MTVMLATSLLMATSGHLQGQHLAYCQPAKMAAAEGLCTGESDSLALFAFSERPDPVLRGDARENSGSKYEVTKVSIGRIPSLLGFVVHNSFSRTTAGVADSSDRTQAMLESAQKYLKDRAPNIDTTNTSGLRGKDDVAGYSWAEYAPSILPVFWSFRLMMGVGIFMAALAMLGLYQTRGGRVSISRDLRNLALITFPMPSLGVSSDWIMAEIGRQPFIVYPDQDAFNADVTVQDADARVCMLTGDDLSGVVSLVEFLVSPVVFTPLCLVLGIIWFRLLVQYSKEDTSTPASDGGPISTSREPSFAY